METKTKTKSLVIRIIVIALFAIIGFSLFLFSPFNTFNETQKIANQTRQLYSDEIQPMLKGLEYSAPVAVSESIPVLDLFMKYFEKLIGLGSSLTALILTLQTIKKNKEANENKPVEKKTKKPTKRPALKTAKS